MSRAPSVRFAVGVCGSLPGRQAIELAAEMARLLSAQMTALIFEDGASDALGSLPFAREFVTGPDAWQEIGVQDIAARRAFSRRRAQALFAEVASSRGVPASVQTIAGSGATDIAHAIAQFDFVVLNTPERAGEWMLLPFAALADATLQARATTLILPPRLRRKHGPIVAIVDRDDKRAIELAGRLARASEDALILLVAGLEDLALDIGRLSQIAEVPQQRLRVVAIDEAEFEAIMRTLDAIGERALVIGRRFLSDHGLQRLLRLAMSRGVPVMSPGAPES